MLKVFIKTRELEEKNPTVIASYDAAVPVPDDAHGKDVVAVLVSERQIHNKTDAAGIQRQHLTESWRDTDVAKIMRAEAIRRIEAVMPLEQQIAAVQELVMMILEYGIDISKWPPGAQGQKAEIERRWRYIREINERAATHTTVPLNPASDRNWPTRIT